LIATRWHDLADSLGEPGEEALAGDFIQLLIREGLVKPDGLTSADWETWNAGYNVSLRVEALLNELDPHVARILPARKGGATARSFDRAGLVDRRRRCGLCLHRVRVGRSPAHERRRPLLGNLNALVSDAITGLIDRDARRQERWSLRRVRSVSWLFAPQGFSELALDDHRHRAVADVDG
jgi:hypothetical protein